MPQSCNRHSPLAACSAIAARKCLVALASLCRRCSPALRELPSTYSITDARFPCAHTQA